MFHKILASFCFLCALCPLVQGEKVNLIWQLEEPYRFEQDWIFELLSGNELNVISDCNYEIFLDNSIVVISANIHSEKHHDYFAKLHALNYRFGIIHLSDELYYAPTDFYPFAKFVFRNYWHKKFADQDNVYYWPLGYKAGFWSDGYSLPLPTAAERVYKWIFAGQIHKKASRVAMADSLKNIRDYFIHEIYFWADPTSLDVIDYRNLFLEAQFIPCPRGFWNLDTFRLAEALECGCIPIVEREPLDYFKEFFGNHPFIVVDNWEQARQQMQELIDQPEKLEQRRIECYTWWINYKAQLKEKIDEIIKTNLKIVE